jgi:hypothetical protein
MELAVAVILLGLVFAFVVGVRARDLPIAEPASVTQHLEDRRARIYEGLRDLQFEYRVGKLSEEDYQRTKLDLQQQLASTLAEIDKLAPPAAVAAPASKPAASAPPKSTELTCPHCSAKFDKPMKFCGECGKAIA